MEEGRKRRALVVDDDPLIRRVEGMLLSGYGLETKAVENGKEAIDLFVAGKTFDLVLMDMEMPVMNGPEATRALRALGVSCMIVGVTACGDEAKKAAFVAAGLDSCWDKPLNARIVDELAKKLI
ncbi:two-component response regulator 24-like [Salvia miltiorrhiza]|uniref:two-component response regulator 24-like n=1 Tax=Salvia miltiorrhiza TaxID=226208 RepID=UPI0025ABC4CD|nr:two-component response regulator 24-like [Salvia miltiorrhiza]